MDLIKTDWSVICPLCCCERWPWVGDNNPSRSRLLRLLVGQQRAEELASMYICYSTGEWFNIPPSSFVYSTCVQQ